MRSRAEIAFRLKQETRNVLLRLFPPSLPKLPGGIAVPVPLSFLPDPEPVFQRLAGSEFARDCERIADLILTRRFPMLGIEIATEPRIRWRRDYLSGIETPAFYFRRIPYLDPARAGDHKIIWELNRHQHLVVLAQAYRFTGRKEFLDDIERQFETWFEDNPFQCGINWTSALEVAFRALSWIWLLHFVGNDFAPAFRTRFLTWLYRHGEHLAANLSIYFSPNTHLLGEALALHALGLVFDNREWAETGARTVREEMRRQVRDDGSHFEQSTYYHVYALDMFLFESALAKPDENYVNRLAAMARFLHALMPYGKLPFLGDDDGGRLMYPYGDRDRFGAGTLASSPWLFDETALDSKPAPSSVRFPDSGIVVMASGSARIICDAGPFGPGSAGHSHSDTLSIVASDGDEELLIDPGTYTYVGDPLWRNRFRGSGAHNTVRVDGLDQADPSGPFSWKNPPQVEIIRWDSRAEYDLLIATCRSRGILHKRSILFLKGVGAAMIVDDVMHPGLIEQFWHPGTRADQLSPGCFSIGDRATLTLSAECARTEGGEFGWRSPAPGRKTEAILLTVSINGLLPVRLGAVIDFNADGVPGSVKPESESRWIYDGRQRIVFDFDRP